MNKDPNSLDSYINRANQNANTTTLAFVTVMEWLDNT